MEYSKNGMALTEGFEKCSLTAYQDIKGIWTIGWGHIEGVYPGQKLATQLVADMLLLADVQHAVDYVKQLVTVTLTQDEFDALVDFTFNCGCNAFKNSTMLKLLNSGDYTGASAQFDAWDHASGQVVAGLLRRRQAETDLFKGA